MRKKEQPKKQPKVKQIKEKLRETFLDEKSEKDEKSEILDLENCYKGSNREDLEFAIKRQLKYSAEEETIYNNEELLLHITPKPKSTRQQRTMRTITHTYNTRLKSKMLTK